MADTDPSTISRPPNIEAFHNSSSPTVPTKLSIKNSTASVNKNTTNGHGLSYREQLLRDGYVVVPSLLPAHLLLAAQASCKYLVTRTRTGTFWPYVRTVPKQFPPWPKFTSPDQNLNIWGIQHLLHPELDGLRDVFAEIYFCEQILSVVRDVLARPDGGIVQKEDLVMELFNLLISPGRKEHFELVWHRDDIRPEVDAEEERKLLEEKAPGGRQLHAQYNLALFEDESLIVIPGSHRRVRTEQERNTGKYDVLPGQILVKLNPGDAVFYDSNIFHRGAYAGIDETEDTGRMTLHGSVGLNGFGEERSRQVLQHGVGEWIEKPEAAFANIQDEEKKRAADLMRSNLVAMGSGKDTVEYSLEG